MGKNKKWKKETEDERQDRKQGFMASIYMPTIGGSGTLRKYKDRKIQRRNKRKVVTKI